MKIYAGEPTDAQIEAGLRVMKKRHQFDITGVTKALSNAGVSASFSGAEALIASELRNGRIQRITRGLYCLNSN